MSLRHRVAAVAAAALLAAVGCTEADNGNNTFAGKENQLVPKTTGPATPVGAPQTTAPAEAGGEVELEAKDNEFVPAQLSVKAGDVTIVMNNTGVAPHTFTQQDLNVDVNADAGKTAEIKLTGLKPGKYQFICKYHVPGMVGDLTVT